MTIQEYLDLYAKDKKEFETEIAKILAEGPWKHKEDDGERRSRVGYTEVEYHCSKCGELMCSTPNGDNYRTNKKLSASCPVPDRINSGDLGEALRRFRKLTKNQRFEAMFDITRPHQPNGEFANMPVDRMQELAEYYCLQEASAAELWIIVAGSKENS